MLCAVVWSVELLYIGLLKMTTLFRKERHSVSDLKIHAWKALPNIDVKYLRFHCLAVIEKSFREVAARMGLQIQEFNGESAPLPRPD